MHPIHQLYLKRRLKIIWAGR